jgi:hypothetical protein
MSDEKTIATPEPKPAQAPPAAAPGQSPPPGMIDLEAARYWAGRGPRGQPRRFRPPYALKAMD